MGYLPFYRVERFVVRTPPIDSQGDSGCGAHVMGAFNLVDVFQKIVQCSNNGGVGPYGRSYPVTGRQDLL